MFNVQRQPPAIRVVHGALRTRFELLLRDSGEQLALLRDPRSADTRQSATGVDHFANEA